MKSQEKPGGGLRRLASILKMFSSLEYAPSSNGADRAKAMTDIVLLNIKQPLRSPGSWWARPDSPFLIRLTPAPGKLEALVGRRPAVGNHQVIFPIPLHTPCPLCHPTPVPCCDGCLCVKWTHRQAGNTDHRATIQEALLGFFSPAMSSLLDEKL